MKVRIEELEGAAFGFLQRLIETMPTTGHKLLAGAMLGTSAKKIRKLFEPFAGADGTVDTVTLREIVKSGFASSGARATFTIGDDSIKWLLRPVDVSITEQDVLEMLDSVERQHM
jgi:hypothetical protein